MAATARETLKSWFETGDYPTQAQFANLIDSFFSLLEDELDINQVTNLQEALDSKAPVATTAVFRVVMTGALEAGVEKVVEHNQAYTTDYMMQARNEADTNNMSLAVLKQTVGNEMNSITVKSLKAIAAPGIKILMVGV